jgi:chromosome segregation ATPase
MNLVENRRNDPITVANNGYQEKIQQLDSILNEVLILLKTPLMQEVSKSPMVSRPITKTNVLKMNTNFKESLALFDYICAYDKAGYSVTKKEKKIYPLSEAQENSFNDVIQLVSFLSYQYNNGLEKRLADAFKKESDRRLHLKDEELLARIEELKAKAKRNPTENAEYIMQLEQSYDVLKRAVSDAKEETEATKAEAESKIEELNEAHETEKEELKAALEDKVRSLEEELAQANERLETEKKASEALAAELNEKIDLLSTELLSSKLYAKDKSINLFDFTTRERFTKLEEEKKILDRFFEKAWRATKKEIRKKHYDFSKKEGGEQ